MKTRWSFWNWKFKKKEGIWEGSLKTLRGEKDMIYNCGHLECDICGDRQYTIDAGCSRWTNASRPMARHIKYAGVFLCGTKYSGGMLGLNEPFIMEKVTCKKCKQIMIRLQQRKEGARNGM